MRDRPARRRLRPNDHSAVGHQIRRLAAGRLPVLAFPDTGLNMSYVGPLVRKLIGQNPNLGELITSADGVTFWARHDKAIAELGYSPRGLEQGIRDTLAGEGRLPAPA